MQACKSDLMCLAVSEAVRSHEPKLLNYRDVVVFGTINVFGTISVAGNG